MFYHINLKNDEWLKILYVVSVSVKGFCLVPFVTYEYYLLIFENLFVDSSYFLSAQSNSNFLDPNY